MAKTPISIRLASILRNGYGLEYYDECEAEPSYWVIRDQDGIALSEGETLDECIGNYFRNQKPKRKHKGTTQEVAQ